MKTIRPLRPSDFVLSALVAVSLAACTSTAPQAVVPRAATSAVAARAVDAPFWAARPSPADFEALQRGRLARAKALIAELTSAKGPRTIASTLTVYDNALIELEAVGSQAGLLESVHPDAAMRTVAEKLTQEASTFGTELSLNRDVYDALAAMSLEGADDETKHYVTTTLRDFRLAGVDKDAATRARIRALSDELVLIGQEFARNIREDKRSITVDSAAELAGLPEDYIARHKPGPDGKIVITIDYPDYLPVLLYAKSEDLRRRLYVEFNNRAYPQNMAVLDRLIAKRHELAGLLGFPNFAEYVTASKMIGGARQAAEFIDKIVEASRSRAEADYRILLARKQKDEPGAKVVNFWESAYYSELVRKSDYDFDSQKARPYFAYSRVKEGLLDITSKLFGVTIKRVADAPVWHPSVECYEMFEGGKLVGRFYLDMHPRDNKYTHAAEFDIRTGVEGRQIPEATLVCNFPGGEPNDPGLMDHGDVKTFFHEFGHLIHALFAGHGKWVGIGGIRTERDFVEAPSQMLEEWTMDHSVLATFAKHHETGEPIPASLVRQMKRASEFGKGLTVRRQMVYAKTSLSIYDRDPATVNTDEVIRRVTEQYQPYPFVEGTHFQTSFGHLDGYSAVYYTYMWSLVIAKDLFSMMDKANLMDPVIAKRYRDTVLAPGASMPAAMLVEQFLGRPFSFESYRVWLDTSE